LQIQVGTWSICPTSTTFKKTWGTAEEHLALGIRVAKAVGSSVIRVILGNGNDRNTEGGIEARIADTVQVLKACRSRAIDAGVKIAVENHGGDMQSWELVNLIEEAGKDYVGANMDSGNATWTLEDPLSNLENLGPYVLTTSLRDSAIWESEKGATVQWTAMGDGTVDLKKYFARFADLCPHAPVHIETISGFNREFPYLNADFWKAWPKARAKDFARFVALAKQGKPRAAWSPPPGIDRKQAEQQYQQDEVARSIKYCKGTLGLGLRK
jgi:sugar phosphate isomerase/epimerase